LIPVESICAVLRGQGVQVAARSYRACKSRLPALRTLEDARITDAIRDLLVPDGKGRPRPEVISPFLLWVISHACPYPDARFST
jgi:putative transposase